MGTADRLRKAYHVIQAAETLEAPGITERRLLQEHVDETTTATRIPPPSNSPDSFVVPPSTNGGGTAYSHAQNTPQLHPNPSSWPPYNTFVTPHNSQAQGYDQGQQSYVTQLGHPQQQQRPQQTWQQPQPFQQPYTDHRPPLGHAATVAGLNYAQGSNYGNRSQSWPQFTSPIQEVQQSDTPRYISPGLDGQPIHPLPMASSNISGGYGSSWLPNPPAQSHIQPVRNNWSCDYHHGVYNSDCRGCIEANQTRIIGTLLLDESHPAW